MISHESSCRPGKILNLSIRDVVFKTTTIITTTSSNGDNNNNHQYHQYTEILVNGKTGTPFPLALVHFFLFCSCYIKNGMRKGTASAAKTDIEYEQGAAGANK